MKLQITGCLLFILLFIACGSKNDLMYSSTTEDTDLLLLNDSTLSSQKLIKDSALVASLLYGNKNSTIKTLKTKTKVYAQVKDEHNKAQKIDFTMETRILKDSIFWCSLTYFGIEIVRMKATKNEFLVKIIGEKNSFPLYQLLEQQYDSALAHLQKRAIEKKQDISTQIAELENMKIMLDYITNNQREIFMFMNLCFLGSFPFSNTVSDSIWYNELTQQYTFSQASPKGKFTAIFNKDFSSYVLSKVSMKQNKMYLGVSYLEYEHREENTLLPKIFIAFSDMVNPKNQHQILQLRFENNHIKINPSLDFPMPNTKEK